MTANDTERFLRSWFDHCPEGGFIELRIKTSGSSEIESRFFATLQETIKYLINNNFSGKHVWFGVQPRFKLTETERLEKFKEKFKARLQKHNKELEETTNEFKRELLIQFPEIGGSSEYVKMATIRPFDFDCRNSDDKKGSSEKDYEKMKMWSGKLKIILEDMPAKGFINASGNGIQLFVFQKRRKLLEDNASISIFENATKKHAENLLVRAPCDIALYDQSTADIARVMRLPGFSNPKGNRIAEILYFVDPENSRSLVMNKINFKSKTLSELLEQRIGNHGRYDHFVRIVGSCANKGMPQEQVRKILEEFNRTHVEIPAPDNYIDNSLSSYEEWRIIAANQEEDEQEEWKPSDLADAILENFNIKTMYNQDMFYYDEGIFKPNANVLIKIETKNIANSNASSQMYKEILWHIQSLTFMEREKFDPPDYIVLENGVLDLKTLELSPHSEKYLALTKITINYNKDAQCPKFLEFISQILRPEDIPITQELFGYCLLRKYPYQKAFMLTGSGNNGKSTLLAVLRKFLGEHNVSARSLQELEENRFAISTLYGKLANIYPDLSDVALRSTGVFKALTGGDSLSAEKKFHDSFNFQNHAKLIFSANKLPETHDDTDAFFRRWIIIAFLAKFEDVLSNSEEKQADPNLINKLITPEELSGILNWSLEGLARLQKQNKFSHSQTTDQLREKYTRMSDSLAAFVNEHVESSSNGEISKDNFYADYAQYCRKNGLISKSKELVGRQLVQLIHTITGQSTINGKIVRVWRGIVYKEESTVVSNNIFIEKQKKLPTN